MWVYKPRQGFGEWHPLQHISKQDLRRLQNAKRDVESKDTVCNSFGISYTEPTPACYHSYGLDHECVLRRGSELQERRQQLLLDRLPPLQSAWDKKQKKARSSLNPREPPKPTVVLDPRDPVHHSEAWPTEKESQSIGWFADQTRLPKCRLRDWPKSLSFV